MSRQEKFFKFALVLGTLSSVLALILIKTGIKSQFVFAIKDIPIYLYAFFIPHLWLNKKRNITLLALIFIFTLCLLLNYIIINPFYNAPINNIRQLISPLLVLLISCTIRIPEKSKPQTTNLIYKITIFIFVFGLIEQVFQIWSTIDLSVYFNLKGIPTDSNGVSYMFYEPLFNYRERMTSVFLDPISLGHFFATVFLFVYYKKNKTRIEFIILILTTLGLLLALSKGALLQAFIGVTLLNGRIPLFIKSIGCILIVAIIINLPQKQGILIHINGLINSLESLTFFGYGIGSVGNYAKMFSNNLNIYYSLGISDTFIGAVLGQIGLIGTLIWLALICSIIFFSKGNMSALQPLRLLASILIVSVLSENTMNITSFLLPALIIGFSYTKAPSQRESRP